MAAKRDYLGFLCHKRVCAALLSLGGGPHNLRDYLCSQTGHDANVCSDMPAVCVAYGKPHYSSLILAFLACDRPGY